jgi:hypothetical protein
VACSALQQGQRFGVQHAGFQHKHGMSVAGVDQVGDHHVFGAQAGGLRDRGALPSAPAPGAAGPTVSASLSQVLADGAGVQLDARLGGR